MTTVSPIVKVRLQQARRAPRVYYRWDVCPHCLRGDDHIIGKPVRRNRQNYTRLLCPNCKQEHIEED